MTSYFPYYLALFGLLFFISVICCCIKLIDIIDSPVPRAPTTPSWNYANYLQNSPVAILSPQPNPLLRCAMLAENHGLSIEEYLTATASGPGLYTSTSRDAISAQYANSMMMSNSLHQGSHKPPPAPAPSSNPSSSNPTTTATKSPNPASITTTANVYTIPVPDEAVRPTTPTNISISKSSQRSRQKSRYFRQSSLREREFGDEERERPPLRPSRSRSSMREYTPKYEDICFDV